MTKVRVRYAPSPLGMQEQHYLTTYLPATMTENLSFVSRIPTKNGTSKTARKVSWKT